MKITFLPSKSLVHSVIFQLWFIAINFCFKIHKTKIAAQEKARIHKEAMVDISLGCVCEVGRGFTSLSTRMSPSEDLVFEPVWYENGWRF